MPFHSSSQHHLRPSQDHTGKVVIAALAGQLFLGKEREVYDASGFLGACLAVFNVVDGDTPAHRDGIEAVAESPFRDLELSLIDDASRHDHGEVDLRCGAPTGEEETLIDGEGLR